MPSRRTSIFAVVFGLLPTMALAADTPAVAVDFNRDIRPILSDTCFHCHGPDQARRQAKLRLDVEADALADRDGRPAIVPGQLAKSELYRRITAADEAERMPPADSGRKLTIAQIELLSRWIAQGARWQKHWSLLAPVRPGVPPVQDASWVRNPIDAFVLARLEQENLRPSPEAERTTLIRRATLDLTGLPPTPVEVDAFLADDSPAAYERVIDRLLALPRYGERMASRWLDAARYADTNGYQSDGERFMWRWRDWVIEAYNRNLPFDRFTIEQLAGDLLPEATLEQRIATGFNRNHRGNAEGGIVPEEYAVEYVVDRVDTTATVWLGLTMGCARCHDHKYDPISQREFYQVYSFFNNVPERGKAIKYGNSPPLIPAPTRSQLAELASLAERLAAAEREFARLGPRLAKEQTAWEASRGSDSLADWTFSDGLLAQFKLDGEATAAKFVDGDAAFATGKLEEAAQLNGRRFIDAGDMAPFTFYDKFSIAAWIMPDNVQSGTIVSRMTDVEQGDGYSLCLADGKLQVNLVKRWLDDSVRVETQQKLVPGAWRHVMFTYDGSRVASGVRVYIDGQPAALTVLLDDLNQSFATKEPLRIGGGGGPEGRFRGRIDDVRIYSDSLTEAEVRLAAVSDTIGEILAQAAAERTPPQAEKLAAYYLRQHAPAEIRQAWQTLTRLQGEREALVESFPTTMVMQELPQPRDTFILVRGQYDKPGERVSPGVPASLPPLASSAPNNRLGLAQWLVDPANPLVARVAVNRHWQMLFGTGLVKTVDDFGAQGESPSHPELLDWLATEFVRLGWDSKALLKTMMMSAAYRQSSRVTPELSRRDPENRLLARGPRVRLSAEMIRDQALAAGGLLIEKPGGPSVKPYQPPGLWKDLTGGDDYTPDEGESLYRRSLYTFWKRTIAPPTMMTFDASGRETCSVRETRTNTPLQALTLMNDVTFVEAARKLAERGMTQGGDSPDSRLTLAFRLATARPPKPAELAILRRGFERHLATYRGNETAARELVSIGASPRDEKLAAAELAAYTAVAGLILNLDETITKE